MENLENVQESTLEALVSNSLIEAYKNVAGFRLTDCEYLNEKLNINGTILFTSGKTRNTTFTFTEAFEISKDSVTLVGLNEKLKDAKRFNLSGITDRVNKTFIAESLEYIK
jgi:hypothetical protein